MATTDDPQSSGRTGSEAMTAIGGLGSAYSQIQSGRTNQSILRYNAGLARTQADQAQQAGAFAANRRAMVQSVLAGRTESGQAAGGTVIGAGTNGAVLSSQRAGSAMDQYLIQEQAQRQASADRVRAAGDDLQGSMVRRTGETGALSSLLNTGSDELLLSDPRFDPRFGRGLAVGAAGR